MTDRENIRLLLELFIDQYNGNSIEVAKKDALLINIESTLNNKNTIDYYSRIRNFNKGGCFALESCIEQIAATFNIKVENKLVKSNFDCILSNKAYNLPIKYDEYSIVEG